MDKVLPLQMQIDRALGWARARKVGFYGLIGLAAVALSIYAVKTGRIRLR